MVNQDRLRDRNERRLPMRRNEGTDVVPVDEGGRASPARARLFLVSSHSSLHGVHPRTNERRPVKRSCPFDQVMGA